VTTVALGGTDDDRSVVLLPMLMTGLPFKAFVSEIRPRGRSADAGQRRMGAVAPGEEGLGKSGGSAVAAAPKPTPVMTPTGLTAMRI
jgi:hypothetical protein